MVQEQSTRLNFIFRKNSWEQSCWKVDIRHWQSKEVRRLSIPRTRSKALIGSCGRSQNPRAFSRQMTVCWKCCIWRWWILRKSGQVDGRTGAASMRSCPSILLSVCRLILKLLLFYSCLDFTQNLGETRVRAQREIQTFCFLTKFMKLISLPGYSFVQWFYLAT